MIRSRAVAVTEVRSALHRGSGTGVFLPKSLVLQVTSVTTAVYIGGDDVTVANGYKLVAGDVFTADLAEGDIIYGVCPASETAALKVFMGRQA